MKKPIKVAITGSAGNIGYALVYRVASGNLFGREQPIELSFVEIPDNEKALHGVMMEMEDCAFPMLHSMSSHFDLHKGFRDADYVLLIGSKPRTKGMERKDLLKVNSEIFYHQGLALNDSVSSAARIVVVGNPTNTNMLVALHAAKNIPPTCFSCLLHLDHNRTKAALAKKLEVSPGAITNLTIWGNHSATQFPDIDHCKINGKPVLDLVDREWQKKELIPAVQQRGAKIIDVRGKSSAASAANAIIEHVKLLHVGTPENDWTSMGILSDGSYGIPSNLVFSYPVQIKNKQYTIVPDLSISPYAETMIARNIQELQEERAVVEHYCSP